MLSKIIKYKTILIATLFIFLIKLALNSLLKAENGDTYDFFKIAYYLKSFDFTVESKRMFFLPLLLSYFPTDWYVWVGRIWINLFYFGSVFIFYRFFLLFKDNYKEFPSPIPYTKYHIPNTIALMATLVFATNIVIFENSFYILADTIFLFWNLLYLYIYKKFGSNKWLILTLISGMAFYTRPEGLVLFAITGILLIIQLIQNYYPKIQHTKYKIFHLLSFAATATLIIAPYLIRNYLVFNSFSNAGYFSDKAGFIFDTGAIILRLSSFIFGVGGIWLLPVLYLILSNSKKTIVNFFKNHHAEVLVFTLYTTTLFMWGPYIRLYSLPISLIILFVFLNLDKFKIKKVLSNRVKIVLFFIIFAVSYAFYIVVVQKYDNGDLGYRKIGKLVNLILSSFTIATIFAVNFKNILTKKSFIILFSLSIIICNTLIFSTKFYFTKEKYGTIKQAVLLYKETSEREENLAYANESGLEKWYLQDFNSKYLFNDNINNFLPWANEHNVKFVLSTDEFGYSDSLKFGNKQKNEYNITLVKEFKSSFFEGSTRLWKIN